MGVMVSNNQDNNSELNRRITADLRARAAQSSPDGQTPTIKDTTNNYTAGTKTTGKFTWVWIVLVILAILSIIYIFLPL